MNTKPLWKIIAWLLFLLATGCIASDTPQQIAAYPKSTPIARYPNQYTIIYNAYLELLVSNVDIAAENATQLAYDYGGYLANSQSWYVDGHKATTLDLVVPTINFESLHHSLCRLGKPVNENITGIPVEAFREPQFSQITLHLRTAEPFIALPNLNPPGWNPARTFQRAFGVFLRGFGFLADILIWLLVVVAPFLLLGWLAWKVVLRVRRRL